MLAEMTHLGYRPNHKKPKPKNLCIHGPSVSYHMMIHISTDTLAIETAALLTLCLLLSAKFHVYLLSFP